MEMGKEIRRLRMARGLTQEALAAAFNVTAQTVSKWELGNSIPDVQLLPELAVYFGVADGSFKLWKQYSDVLAHQVDEYLFVNSSLDISPRGTLKISLEYFASAGSADTSQNTYTFRFQDGDFFLIGKDTNSFSRYSGEATNESYNYLTHKQKTTTSNAFDKSVRPKEVWTKLPSAPLQRLGDFRIE